MRQASANHRLLGGDDHVEAPAHEARERVGGPVVDGRILPRDGTSVGRVAEFRVVIAGGIDRPRAREEERLSFRIDEPPAAVGIARGAVEGGVRSVGLRVYGRFLYSLRQRLAVRRLRIRVDAGDAVAFQGWPTAGDNGRAGARPSREGEPAAEDEPAVSGVDRSLHALAVHRDRQAKRLAQLPRALGRIRHQLQILLREPLPVAHLAQLKIPSPDGRLDEREVPVARRRLVKRDGGGLEIRSDDFHRRVGHRHGSV